MRYDLAIFDFDGTLAGSRDWFFGSLNEVADRFGFRQTTPEEREELRRLGTRDIVRYLQAPLWKMSAIARDMRQRASEDISANRLFDAVPEAVGSLRRWGMALAVVRSNADYPRWPGLPVPWRDAQQDHRRASLRIPVRTACSLSDGDERITLAA